MRLSSGPDHPALAAIACAIGLIGAAIPAAAAQTDVPSVYVSEFRGGWGSPRVRVELKGRTLHYKKDDQPIVKITPAPEQWRAFRRAADEADVWSWKERYDVTGADMPAWSLKLAYPARSVASGGDGSGPGRESALIFAWAEQQLLGGRCVCARAIEPLERFKLEELSLVATHPSPGKRAQWAQVRDPSGKAHRVRVGNFVGPHYGRVDEISAEGLHLKELVNDAGEWFERETLMRKKP